MMNLDSAVRLLDELERLSRNRLMLAKSLEAAYTKQLSFISEGNVDSCLECIKTTEDIFLKLNDVNKSIDDLIKGLGIDVHSIQNILYFFPETERPRKLNDIIENIKTSNKVLKNCSTLNERLGFQLANSSEELLSKLNEIKTRKLIEQSYGRIKEPKTGNVIDYKHT